MGGWRGIMSPPLYVKGVHMSRTYQSSFLPTIVVLLALLLVFVFPGYSETSSVDPQLKAKIDALTEKLKDKDEAVRLKAVDDLGDMGLAAVPALLIALEDKVVHVRYSASSKLDDMGPAILPALVTALKDGDKDVRSAAVSKLGG